jgi:hypothetical protein
MINYSKVQFDSIVTLKTLMNAHRNEIHPMDFFSEIDLTCGEKKPIPLII